MLIHDTNAGNVIIRPGHNHGPRWRTCCGGVIWHSRLSLGHLSRLMNPLTVAKAYTLCCELIEVWCLDLPTKAAKVRVAQIVRDDEQEVRPFRHFAVFCQIEITRYSRPPCPRFCEMISDLVHPPPGFKRKARPIRKTCRFVRRVPQNDVKLAARTRIKSHSL